MEEPPKEKTQEVEPEWLKEFQKIRNSAGSSQEQDDPTPSRPKQAFIVFGASQFSSVYVCLFIVYLEHNGENSAFVVT